MQQKIYIISGPPGVGKSTVSKRLVQKVDNSQLIAGDHYLIPIKNSGLTYEQIKEESWKQILSATKENLSKGFNIVIDFVVEDELDWLRDELTNTGAETKYIILMADDTSLTERLKKRNELSFKSRAMFLSDKLSKDTKNKGHFCDTTDREISEVVREIINSTEFLI